MNKLDKENIELNKNKIYFIKDYEKILTNHHNSRFKILTKNHNNVFPIKPEFRQYTHRNIAEEKPESTSTIKTVLVSILVISLWSISMCLLAKASYRFLEEIFLNSVQEFNLNSK